MNNICKTREFMRMQETDIKKKNQSTLVEAARSNNMEDVIYLLNSGEDINQVSPVIDDNELSAIYIALEKGHNDIVDLLLEKGANIDITNCNDNHLLHRVNKKTSFETFIKIIEKNKNASLYSLENSFGESVIKSMFLSFTSFEILENIFEKVKNSKEFNIGYFLPLLNKNDEQYEAYFSHALSFCKKHEIVIDGIDFLNNLFTRGHKNIIKKIQEYYPEVLPFLIEEYKESVSNKQFLLNHNISVSDMFSIYPDREDWSDTNYCIASYAIQKNRPDILGYMLENGLSPNYVNAYSSSLLKYLLQVSKQDNFKKIKMNENDSFSSGFEELIFHKDLNINKPMELLINMYIKSEEADNLIKGKLKEKMSLIEKKQLTETVGIHSVKIKSRI